MRRAAVINFISRYSAAAVQMFMNFILARLISPKEFGVVTIITVFTGFIALFSDMGISPAVIQYKDLENKDYESLYTVTFYIGLILAFFFSLMGFVLNALYGNRVYIPLCAILSIAVFLNSINVVPNAIMMKEQQFLENGVRTFVSALVCGSITICLAFFHFRYYAVVLNSVLSAVFTCIWNCIRRPIAFHFCFQVAPIKKIFRFCSFQMLFSSVSYFASNTDTLLVGKTMGEEKTGLYDKAYQLMTYPMTMFAGIITPVLHPVLSNYQTDRNLLYCYFIKILRILLYFSIFVSCVCYFAPEEIIGILYGSNWEAAVRPFQILSLSIVTKMCNSIAGSFFQTLGKTQVLFKTGVLSTIMIVFFTFAGILGGSLESVAAFVSAGHILNFWLAFYYLMKEGFETGYLEFLKITIKPYSIYVLILAILHFLDIPECGIFLSLITKLLIAAILYGMLFAVSGEWKNLREVYAALLCGNHQ